MLAAANYPQETSWTWATAAYAHVYLYSLNDQTYLLISYYNKRLACIKSRDLSTNHARLKARL